MQSVGVDGGGTFTDIAAVGSAGRFDAYREERIGEA